MKDLLLAFFIFLASVLSPLALTGRFSADDFYQWDSFWYESVVDRGYITSIPPLAQRQDDSNVVCLPAYPKLAAFVQAVTGLDTKWSLIAVAWVFNLAFWFLFIRYLRRLRLETSEFCLLLTALWCFPTSFFLTCAYTESLFLCAVFVYLAEFAFAGNAWRLLAGLTLGLTRLVGAPLAFAYFIAGFLNAKKWTGWQIAILLSPIVGSLSFFVYTKYQFGMWDLYFQMANIGWNVRPNYMFWTHQQTWIGPLISPLADWREIDTNVLSWSMTTLFAWICLFSSLAVVGFGLKDRKFPSGATVMLVAALILFFIPAAGFFELRYQSMSRYLMPVFVCWASWFVIFCRARGFTWLMWGVLGASIIYGLPMKMNLLNRFIASMWVS